MGRSRRIPHLQLPLPLHFTLSPPTQRELRGHTPTHRGCSVDGGWSQEVGVWRVGLGGIYYDKKKKKKKKQE